jgi:hypothetical protein
MKMGRVVEAAKAEGVNGSRPNPLLDRGLLEIGVGRFEGEVCSGWGLTSPLLLLLLLLSLVSGMVLLLIARCCGCGCCCFGAGVVGQG